MNRRIVFDCDQWLERLVLLGFDERMQETAETGICLSLQIVHTHTHTHMYTHMYTPKEMWAWLRNTTFNSPSRPNDAQHSLSMSIMNLFCWPVSSGRQCKCRSQRFSVTPLLDFRYCHSSSRMHGKGDPLLGYLEALQFTSSELQNLFALQCVYDAWIR